MCILILFIVLSPSINSNLISFNSGSFLSCIKFTIVFAATLPAFLFSNFIVVSLGLIIDNMSYPPNPATDISRGIFYLSY